MSASPGAHAPQHVEVDVDVGVSVDDEGALQAYVKDVSQRVALATTKAGLKQYNREAGPNMARKAVRDGRRLG